MPKFLWAIVFVLYHGKVKRFGQQLARVLLCNVGLDDAHSSILVIRVIVEVLIDVLCWSWDFKELKDTFQISNVSDTKVRKYRFVVLSQQVKVINVKLDALAFDSLLIELSVKVHWHSVVHQSG